MSASRSDLLDAAAIRYVTELFSGESSGHDVHHTLRVYRTALSIADLEGGDRTVIALAALLHDTDDPKLFHTENLQNARKFLQSHYTSQALEESVCSIIQRLSFRGSGTSVPASLEGRIVQDADRLDAIGAIGIARAFAYGGSRGRPMHDPDAAPKLSMTATEYAVNQGTTINHFYEKLLRLKNLMHTETGRRMAEHRHACMEAFLKEFYAEWDGAR